MDKRNRILTSMAEAGHEATMDVIRRYLVVNTKSRHAALDSLVADGTVERVVVEDGAVVTLDGRPVFWFGHDPWAPTMEAHTQRLQALFERKKVKQADKNSETKSVVGTETLSEILCPKCGDALQHTAVCPSCAAGKIGYRHRYSCVCGGTDLISKEML